MAMAISMEKKRTRSDIWEDATNLVVKRVKHAFRHQPQKYDEFLSILTAAKNDPQLLSLRLQPLLSGHPDLVLGINRFLPPHFKLRLHLDQLPSAIGFAKAVKLRLDAGLYTRFLDALNLYRKGCYQDESIFLGDVCHLFKGYADLQETFIAFVNPLESQGLALCSKVKAELAHNPNDYESFLKILHQHSNGLITGVELQMSVADLVHNCPLVLGDLASFMQACTKLDRRKVSSNQVPIQDMEPVEDESINPSYKLRPKSRRTEQVLNDTWVSVCKDDGYGHAPLKSKEQRMRQVWDDTCYEYDMVIHQARSTATYAQEQLEILSSGTKPCYKVHFSGPNLACIRSLYRDEDEYVLRQDPLHWLPVIISRLYHKEEEWTRAFAKWRAQNPTPSKLKRSHTCLRL